MKQSSFTKGHSLTAFSKVFFCPGQIVIRLHKNKKIEFLSVLTNNPGYCCIVVKQFFHKISIALWPVVNKMVAASLRSVSVKGI